jgi:hypothetical protein
MQNIKPQVVTALTSDPTLTSLVGDNIFYSTPDKDASYPCVSYREADNSEHPFGDDLENVTEILMVIDVWHTDSTSDIALAIDNVMKSQGFYREFAQDLDEQDKSQIIYRKNMRYRKLRVFDGATGTVYVDPWVNALVEWTNTALPTWNVYAGMYPEQYERPCVIWVAVGTPITERVTSYMLNVRRRFVGVVLSDLPYYHLQASEIISSGLQEANKIVLDEEDNRYLTVGNTSSSVNPDSITSCRLSVELSRMTANVAQEVGTFVRTIGINGVEVTGS